MHSIGVFLCNSVYEGVQKCEKCEGKSVHYKSCSIFMLRMKISAAQAAVRLKPTVAMQMAYFLGK